MPDSDVTRGEFSMLTQQVMQNQTRLESIDDHGTRGVGTLTTRMDTMVKDLLELKADMVARFIAHDALHEKDKQERVSGRRWLIATAVAGVGSMGAVLVILVDILQHVHG